MLAVDAKGSQYKIEVQVPSNPAWGARGV